LAANFSTAKDRRKKISPGAWEPPGELGVVYLNLRIVVQRSFQAAAFY
jgi:hypothetical protein